MGRGCPTKRVRLDEAPDREDQHVVNHRALRSGRDSVVPSARSDVGARCFEADEFVDRLDGHVDHGEANLGAVARVCSSQLIWRAMVTEGLEPSVPGPEDVFSDAGASTLWTGRDDSSAGAAGQANPASSSNVHGNPAK